MWTVWSADGFHVLNRPHIYTIHVLTGSGQLSYCKKINTINNVVRRDNFAAGLSSKETCRVTDISSGLFRRQTGYRRVSHLLQFRAVTHFVRVASFSQLTGFRLSGRRFSELAASPSVPRDEAAHLHTSLFLALFRRLTARGTHEVWL